MFPVRYELNLYILLRRSLVFKWSNKGFSIISKKLKKLVNI
jgi:hypothetical protein